MNILHITRHNKGATGYSAYSTHQNLKKHGYNSQLLVRYNNNGDEDVIQIKKRLRYFYYRAGWIVTRILKKTLNIKKLTNNDYHFYNEDDGKTLFLTKDILKQIPIKPDIIILYWVTDFISSKNIYELNKITKAPVIWYCMDMAPLTGGCHYAWECEGYKKDCGSCPALFSSNKKDNSFNNLFLKKKYLDKTNLSAIAPVEWLNKQIKESSIFRDKKISNIMQVREPNLFRPYDKQLARQYYYLPKNQKIIFFGAVSFNQKRKGLLYLIRAFESLEKILLKSNIEVNNVLLLIAGKDHKDLFNEIHFNYKHIGMLNDKELALAYQASDLFVSASIQDVGPFMILESLLCATPVVSFNMGSAFDLVHNGKTGYLATLKDSKDLAQGMYEIINLNSADYKEMSKNCRELALSINQWEIQAKKLEKHFKSILLV